jgi:dTDP-4-dehydrorhamnose 3,5-epimerase
VLIGTVFDVVVDLRRSSPSFGRWFGLELSADNRRMLWAPPGLAHGFLTLSSSADLIYKCTAIYSPADERAVRWDDPALAIAWPLAAGEHPALSDKDAAAPAFAEAALFP